MNKRVLTTVSTIIFLFAFLFVHQKLAKAETENYISTKIKIGSYSMKNGKSFSGTNSVSWWNLEPFHIAVDDKHQIYILDIYRNKVLHVGVDGNFINEINLKGSKFPYVDRSTDGGYMDYMIQVSADGSLIYITDESKELIWNIIDKNGMIIKKNIFISSYFNRVCGNKFFTDGEIMDSKLNVIKQVTKHVYAGEVFDSNYDFYSIKAKPKEKVPFLRKIDINRQEIWKTELKGYKRTVRLLGTDGGNNLYVLTDGPSAVIKINKSGQVVANISLPDDDIFSNVNYKKGIYRVLCDGSIYYFPPYINRSKEAQQATQGEYAVYRFDKK